MSFLAGGYTVTYNGASVGQLFEGITFQAVHHKEIITGDNFARAAQDAVFQGVDITSDFTLTEWNAAGAQGLYWPYGTTFLTALVVGRLDVGSSLAKSLVLTAVAGTPAAASPATATLTRSILHEDFPVPHIFRPAHRRLPVRLRHYPTESGTSAVYGTLT